MYIWDFFKNPESDIIIGTFCVKKGMNMRYYIDNIKVQNEKMVVLGWAVSNSPDVGVKIAVRTKKGDKVKIHRTNTERYDVNQDAFHGQSTLKLGFCILLPYDEAETYYMYFGADGKVRREKLVPGDDEKAKRDKKIRIKAILRGDTLERGVRFLRQYGVKAFVKKLERKIRGAKIDYNVWRKQVQRTPEQLDEQRVTVFEEMPTFSIICPVYQTPEKFLKEMIASVQAQTYGKWQLCLADGSGVDENGKDLSVEAIVKPFLEADSRILYKKLPENYGIAGNTNEALSMATGDYVVLMDHDDVLTPDALFECVKKINADGLPEVLYSDEDKLVAKNKKDPYHDPHFKPDFDPDLLRSMNYISHLFVVKRQLAVDLGGFDPDFDGAQDYDFIFRCTERAQKISHVARVLYHWRVSEQSTAEDPKKKLYAFEAGARAIKAHCQRVGIGEVEVRQNEVLGAYRVVYPVKGNPRVSVVIPNKDHTDDLKTCVKSVLEKATYKNIEVIVVENNSTEEKTFKDYEELQETYENLKVITWDPEGRGFNFSAINNYALPYVTGEYILFLNNDTEIINPDCIEEMLGVCQREDVGIVGARLFYDDDTLQHAGVVIGFGGIAGHTFIGYHRGEKTYFLRAFCTQDMSAVTAACLMTKKSIFEEVGGFYEGLAVAFNDIDYCMKVRALGKLVVYQPFAELYHYESKSRGIEDSPEKVLRFEKEVRTFRERWPEILAQGDPYYNPNLTLLDSDFSLRNFEKEPLED